MTNPTDPRRVPEQLTPEERALAERLAAAAPRREPSPALDARILAAARAPAAGAFATIASDGAVRRPSAMGRPRNRWPAFAGLAATLAIAFGLSWQLRPTAEIERSQSEMSQPPAVRPARGGGPQAEPDGEPAGSMARDYSSSESISSKGDFTAEKPPGSAPAAPAASADSVAPSTPSASSAPAPEHAPGERESAAPASAREAAPAIVFDQPIPVQQSTSVADSPAPTLPLPAPPAPPPTTAPSPSKALRTIAAPQSSAPQPLMPQASSPPAIQAQRKAANRGAMDAAAAADAAADATAEQRGRVMPRAANDDGTELDRVEITGSRVERFGDQPLDDHPPASASAPLVRGAWIKRIRQLRDSGEWDSARASLVEYRRRYPEATVPDDLLPLLAP